MESGAFPEDRVANMELPPEMSRREQTLLDFDSRFEPTISVRDYIDRISSYLHCTFECYVLAFALLERLEATSSLKLTPLNTHRLMLISTRVATKYLNDKHYQNKYFAEVGGVPVAEFNYLELAFVYALSFRLYVEEDQFRRLYAKLWHMGPPHPFDAGHRPRSTEYYDASDSRSLVRLSPALQQNICDHITNKTVARRVRRKRAAYDGQHAQLIGACPPPKPAPGMYVAAPRASILCWGAVRPPAGAAAGGSGCGGCGGVGGGGGGGAAGSKLRRSQSMQDIACQAGCQQQREAGRALRRTQSLGDEEGAANAGELLAATANSVACAVLRDLEWDPMGATDEKVANSVACAVLRDLEWDPMATDDHNKLESPTSVEGLCLLSPTRHHTCSA